MDIQLTCEAQLILLALFIKINSFIYTFLYIGSLMDRITDPCTDFYKYACGRYPTWHPLEAEESERTIYSDIGDQVESLLSNLLAEPPRVS